MNNRIAEIKDRLEKATPSPWYADIRETGSTIVSDEGWVCQLWFKTEEVMENHVCNAEFIAHAPEDIQYLLEITDILREVCKIALEDLENTFPDDAELSNIDTRESIRVLRRTFAERI